MSYHKREFQKLNDDFEEKSSILLNDDNPSIDQFETVIDSYNAIISYAVLDYERKKEATREFIQSTIGVNRITLQRCFGKLNLPIILPGKLLSTIHYLPQQKDNSNANQSSVPHAKSDDSDPNSAAKDNSKSIPAGNSEKNNTHTMAQTVDTFLKSASNIINYKFNGDPLKVNGFIADAKLVASLAQNEDTKQFCLTFVKSRLEGRAEESIPDDCDSVEKLTKALKEKLKPDNSNIIEGKILALRLQKSDYSKFAEEAEKLGEALRRSLIVEGLTKQKSEEMTIRRMVELCRKTAKADVVKSVLESTKYDSAADVIATFITQSDIARREYKETQLNRQKKSNSNNAGNGNGQRNKNYNKNRNNGGNRSNDNRPNENRSNGNYRGRNNQNNQNQQQRGRNNNNRPNRQEHTIRLVSGSQPSTSAEQPQQQQEQFFRLEN